MIDKTHAAGIESMLAQIRQYQAQVRPPASPMAVAQGVGDGDDIAIGGRAAAGVAGIREAGVPVAKPTFGQVVRQAVGEVNEAQLNARQMATAYERGEEVSLTDAVIAMQKSSLAFEATLQVRNKVLKAYEDILNMPV